MSTTEFEGAWQAHGPPVQADEAFRGPAIPANPFASGSLDETTRFVATAAVGVLVPALETAIAKLSANASALVNSTLESLPEVVLDSVR